MASEDVVCAHVLVSGRVQGVWYRDSTRQVAERLGVAGWVRNVPDGRVEAVFEGPRGAVDGAISWAGEGPERAIVDEIAVEWKEPTGQPGFFVR